MEEEWEGTGRPVVTAAAIVKSGWSARGTSPGSSARPYAAHCFRMCSCFCFKAVSRACASGAFSRRQVRTANSDGTTHCEFLLPPLQVCEARLHVCAAFLPARLLTGQVIVRLALERYGVVLFMRVRAEARLHRRIRKGVLSSIRVCQSLCSRGSCSSRLITLNASIRAERLERQAHAPSRALAVGDPRTGSTCCEGVRTV